MLTREETIKAFECCYMTHNCERCPFDEQGEWECDNGPEINKAVIHYLKENEPALSANSTSSEVSQKEDTTSLAHLDDSTKEKICQAYDTADKACTDILLIYDEMSECEQRAFDIGEVYGKICSTRDKLENMRGEN